MILSQSNITTPEQNTRLLAIGLDSTFADEQFTDKYSLMENTVIDNNEKYGFTLTKLLDLLPDYIIVEEYGMCYETSMALNKNYIMYGNTIYVKRPLICNANSYIEMIIQTFEQLHSNGYWSIENIK